MREPLQERGRRRRDALLEAAVALLEEGGFAAVSHRAVAERAHVPLGATTYYFRSRDALLTQAFQRLVEREVGTWHQRLAGLDGGTADTTDALPSVLLPAGEEERARQLALWELYLHAGRDPALRRPARAWTEGCIAAATELTRPAGYPPEAVRLLVVTLQGVLLHNLVEARPDAVEFTKYAVATLLQVLNQPGYRLLATSLYEDPAAGMHEMPWQGSVSIPAPLNHLISRRPSPRSLPSQARGTRPPLRWAPSGGPPQPRSSLGVKTRDVAGFSSQRPRSASN